MRFAREAWILAALLLLFVGFSALNARRGFEEERRSQPSSYSTGPDGLAAPFRLLDREGFRTGRLESSYAHLPEELGLLIAASPFKRPFSDEERTSLEEWIDGGGALLLFVNAAPALNTEGSNELPVRGVEVRERDSATRDLAPLGESSPYLRDVGRLHVGGALRLAATGRAARPHTLVGDSQGAYALAWKQGAGEVIVVTGGIGAENAGLASADNAVFLLNIAAVHTGRGRPLVLFDEYHQGYGEESGGRSLWEAIGAPARTAAWYLLVVFLLVVYNANRRFGAPIRMPAPQSRPSTEYIASMAGLYRRAAAAGVAIELIYRAFMRDLANRIDAPPDAGPEQIAALASRRLGWNEGPLRELMTRCEVVLGGATVPTGEMVKLTREMQEYRRKAELARPT